VTVIHHLFTHHLFTTHLCIHYLLAHHSFVNYLLSNHFVANILVFTRNCTVYSKKFNNFTLAHIRNINWAGPASKNQASLSIAD
jgi:hypothetical protein